MALADFWIFLSAVTAEFGRPRQDVAKHLRAQGFQVREQSDFRYEHESETLLRKLHDYIRDCDAVVAIVGAQSGAEPGAAEMAHWAHLLPAGMQSASYTQWEVIFARHYGKRLLLLGAREALRPAQDHRGWLAFLRPRPVRPTALQQHYVAWLRDIGLQREEFGPETSVTELAIRRVEQLGWRDLGRAVHDLPQPVLDYLARIQRHTLRRMSQITRRHLGDLGEARPYFADRTAVGETGDQYFLPGDVLRAAEWHRRDGHGFDELLILGGAGDGKSTLVISTLAELAQPRNVRRWRLVPLLADCVTLSRLFTADRARDSEAMDRWLSLAVGASEHGFNDPAGTRTDADIARELLRAMASNDLHALIIIDGLDELDPGGSAEESEQPSNVARFFQALRDWEASHGLQQSVHLATSRPSGRNLEGISGLRPVHLRPPDRREVRRLVRALGLREELLGRFEEMFYAPHEIDGRLVYLQPLLSYFIKHPADAAAGSPAVYRTQLLELEMSHGIEEIQRQLRTTMQTRASDVALRTRLRELFVLIALDLADFQDPERNSDLGRDRIGELAAAVGLGQAGPVESDRLIHKVLDVLVESGNLRVGPVAEPYYRLPHNEYRDFLLADGLLRHVTDGSTGAQARATLARLARAYHRLERVRSFASGSSNTVEDPRFATMLVTLMNDRDRLPDEDVDERADCSCLGALATLLLSLPVRPTVPVLETAGRNFHGLRVPTGRPVRPRLPGTRDWRATSLRDADLRGADLTGMDLTDADLDNSLLNGADLSGAVLVRANLRNVAMGRYGDSPTVFLGTVFDDAASDGSGPDWFNYRIPGLAGYYCFWDVQPVLGGRILLVAGSRGELVMLDLEAAVWNPVYLTTEHVDDIFDVTAHPSERIIATTSRDNTVRLHALPPGDPRQWATTVRADGTPTRNLRQLAVLRDPFPPQYYTRRAAFSQSGEWLAVIGRDPRVAFVRLPDLTGQEGPVELTVTAWGRSHAGPVMCLVRAPDHEITTTGNRVSDHFYTAGYDGRVVLWSEGDPRSRADRPWDEPPAVSAPALTDDGNRDIIRAVALRYGDQSARVLVGTEDSRVRVFLRTAAGIAEDHRSGARFAIPNGVFSLAIHDNPDLLALGFANGEAAVYRIDDGGVADWATPWRRCRASNDIVRAMAFGPDGQTLVLVTWDGTISLFALDDEVTGAPLSPARTFEFPESQWLPEADTAILRFDASVDLGRSRGMSTRMSRYLARVGSAGSGGDHGHGRTPSHEHR